MSLLPDNSTDETPQDAYEKLKKMNAMTYKTLNTLHKVMFDFVWHNKTFTPKEMITAMGTDAATIFAISRQVQGILVTVNPTGYQVLEPTQNVTMNEDGSANVGE